MGQKKLKQSVAYLGQKERDARAFYAFLRDPKYRNISCPTKVGKHRAAAWCLSVKKFLPGPNWSKSDWND